MVIFHSYVSLPEGKIHWNPLKSPPITQHLRWEQVEIDPGSQLPPARTLHTAVSISQDEAGGWCQALWDFLEEPGKGGKGKTRENWGKYGENDQESARIISLLNIAVSFFFKSRYIVISRKVFGFHFLGIHRRECGQFNDLNGRMRSRSMAQFWPILLVIPPWHTILTYSDILSDIPFGSIIWHTHTYIYIYTLTFYLTLSDILSVIYSDILSRVRVQACPAAFGARDRGVSIREKIPMPWNHNLPLCLVGATFSHFFGSPRHKFDFPSFECIWDEDESEPT